MKKTPEAICERFGSAWQAGRAPQIESLLINVGASDRPELLQRLLEIELSCRRNDTPQPSVSEYRARFPDYHSIVADAFEQFLHGQTSGQSIVTPIETTVSRDGGEFETHVEDGTEREKIRFAPDAPRRQFGRYRLQRELGRGGMGAVYLAHDDQLNRRVALKIPTFREGVRDEMLTRFYREARAAAALREPGLCPVYDVGEVDGQAFIAMAYIEGRPLREFTKSRKPQDPEKTARVVRKVAMAMREAHAEGIVHRDLKPANIMMEKDRRPVVMDFGLAYSTSEQESRLTGTGAVLGTPMYMSPEQAAGNTKDIGPPTDIYSLGVIFYEMLAGRVPFEGSVMAVLTQIATVEPTPFRELGLNIDSRLEDIVRRMMAKRVSDRYSSMDEVVAALTECLQDGTSDGEQLEDGVEAENEAEPKSASLQPLSGASSEPVTTSSYAALAGSTLANTDGNRPSNVTESVDQTQKKKNRESEQQSLYPKDAGEAEQNALDERLSEESRPRRWLDRLHSPTQQESQQPTSVGLVSGGVAVATVLVILWLAFFPSSQEQMGQERGGAINNEAAMSTVAQNSIGMRFVLIAPGAFSMGEGVKAHKVTLTHSFQLGVCEVTQEQYVRVMGTNPSAFKGSENPVETVSWDDAVEFCQKLSALPAERSAGYVYRLPTESEWEYACRAGTESAYSFGSNTSQLGDHAWYDKNSGQSTHPVGQKKPNGWGLHDMHGNVWEWCDDRHADAAHNSMTDAKGVSSEALRVHRGGSWAFDSEFCRSAAHGFISANERGPNLGFRVLRTMVN